MARSKRSFRPSPAMIVACIALFVAMGGVGVAALKLSKNSVKTKTIKNGAVTTPKFAANALAPNAAKLNGVAASGYQGFCQAGSIKGTLVIDTTGVRATFQNATGFNCGLPGNTTTSVQIRRTTNGEYDVLFVGGAGGTGSAVVSSMQQDFHASATGTGGGVFHVIVETLGGSNTDNKSFALVAFCPARFIGVAHRGGLQGRPGR